MELHIVNSGQVVIESRLLAGGDEDYVIIGTADEHGELTNHFRLSVVGARALRDELDTVLFDLAVVRR